MALEKSSNTYSRNGIQSAARSLHQRRLGFFIRRGRVNGFGDSLVRETGLAWRWWQCTLVIRFLWRCLALTIGS